MSLRSTLLRDHPRSALLRDQTRLRVVHQQRVRRQGDAELAPAFSRDAYPAATMAAAASGWQSLLDTEYESVVIASWMTAALTRLGAPLDLLGAFGRIVEDELRHVDVCAQLVDAFGGSPTIVRGELPPLPTDLARGSDGEFETISGLVSFFCVFEFLSGHIFHAALNASHDPLARWAIGEIYRDEAFHGAFGFETATYFVPGFSDQQRATLAQRVQADVQRFEQRLRGRAAAEPDELSALEQLGLLSTEKLLPTFVAALTTQLIPRLAKIGISVTG